MERILIPAKNQSFEFGRVINPVHCTCKNCDFLHCPKRNYAVRMVDKKHTANEFFDLYANKIAAINKHDKVNGVSLKLTYAMLSELIEDCISFPQGTYWSAGNCSVSKPIFEDSIYSDIDIQKISRSGLVIRLGAVDVRNGKILDFDLNERQHKCAERISNAFLQIRRLLTEKYEQEDKSCVGWLDRNGKLYKCNPGQHAELAKKLGYNDWVLENRGWVKIFWDSPLSIENGYYCGMMLSLEQQAKLRELGYRIEEYNG